MANGKQIAEQNLQIFLVWLANKTDQDFREMVVRGVLSRKEIAKECGFAKSSLDQNPRIKAELKAAENALRERGVLPALAEKSPGSLESPALRETGSKHAVMNQERLTRLEQENATLRAENAEFKRQLQRFSLLQDALASSGRLPR